MPFWWDLRGIVTVLRSIFDPPMSPYNRFQLQIIRPLKFKREGFMFVAVIRESEQNNRQWKVTVPSEKKSQHGKAFAYTNYVSLN